MNMSGRLLSSVIFLALSMLPEAVLAQQWSGMSISPFYIVLDRNNVSERLYISSSVTRPKYYTLEWLDPMQEGGSSTQLQRIKAYQTSVMDDYIMLSRNSFKLDVARPSVSVNVQANYLGEGVDMPFGARIVMDDPSQDQDSNYNSLPDGEYMAFLQVAADPVAPISPNLVAEEQEDLLSVSLSFRYAMAIPVMYRLGDLSVQAMWGTVFVDKNAGALNVSIDRFGDAGLYGNLRLEGRLINGESVLLAETPAAFVPTWYLRRHFSMISAVQTDGSLVDTLDLGAPMTLRYIPHKGLALNVQDEISLKLDPTSAAELGIYDMLGFDVEGAVLAGDGGVKLLDVSEGLIVEKFVDIGQLVNEKYNTSAVPNNWLHYRS